MKCFKHCQSPCNNSHRQRQQQHKTFQELCFIALTATCLYIRHWYYQFTALQLSTLLQPFHRHQQLQVAIPAEHPAPCISPVQSACLKQSSRRIWLCSVLCETKHQVKHKFPSWRQLFPPHCWFSWPAPKLWAERFKWHNQTPATKEVWLSLPSWIFSMVLPSHLLPLHPFCSALSSPNLVGLVRGGSYRKAMTSTATNRNVKLTKTFLAKYIPFTGKQPIQQPVQFSRLRNSALWFLIWISAESNIKNDSRQR